MADFWPDEITAAVFVKKTRAFRFGVNAFAAHGVVKAMRGNVIAITPRQKFRVSVTPIVRGRTVIRAWGSWFELIAES